MFLRAGFKKLASARESADSVGICLASSIPAAIRLVVVYQISIHQRSYCHAVVDVRFLEPLTTSLPKKLACLFRSPPIRTADFSTVAGGAPLHGVGYSERGVKLVVFTRPLLHVPLFRYPRQFGAAMRSTFLHFSVRGVQTPNSPWYFHPPH